jgi:hypothetical protein
VGDQAPLQRKGHFCSDKSCWMCLGCVHESVRLWICVCAHGTGVSMHRKHRCICGCSHVETVPTLRMTPQQLQTEALQGGQDGSRLFFFVF